VEQIVGVDFGGLRHRLRQMGQADQQQQDERNCRQQRVKRQSTCEKWNIVFISRLERAADEAGG
jgi:hypothetical protein